MVIFAQDVASIYTNIRYWRARFLTRTVAAEAVSGNPHTLSPGNSNNAERILLQFYNENTRFHTQNIKCYLFKIVKQDIVAFRL